MSPEDGPKAPGEFDEVTPGTEDDSTDKMPENTLPVTPEALSPEVIDRRQGMFGVQGSGDTSGYAGVVRPVTMPGGTPPPYGGWFDEVATGLESALGRDQMRGAIEKVVVHRGEITFFVRRSSLLAVAENLRNDPALRFEFCSGVSGVHYPGDRGRELHAVYHLLSMTHNRRIRLEVTCPDADPHIPSVVSVYPTNDWHERETYDFFGIIFDGHPALTRIEMPDDWPGHPQRKDYPLGGIPVEYKGATIPPPDQRRSYT
ncbi:MAG: NADH-ubiquinone oxidoreductase chain C [uncultured Nocardioidaceae bacterium]|uniref:NADH-quinone oxidoreductase subunit C n=1 Tax=uncultured Nocardioidaceae bacterium TaxID=253824 RepID=A0A6J4MC28_9ACTN|nr:MAG: NADH-ubiquinone oxidoreductase chain C [uncultured Nocardioidaceae bacterium]